MEISSSLLAEQLRYTHWASQRLLAYALTVPDEDVARHIGNSHGSILKTFQHTYYADRMWHSRFTDAPRPGAEFADADPGPSLADLNRDWWPLLERFEATARDLDPNGILHYKTLKDDALERPNWQAILHIVNHGTYHRGQIASMLRQQGHLPPSTDLI